jgi:hypothetical protein
VHIPEDGRGRVPRPGGDHSGPGYRVGDRSVTRACAASLLFRRGNDSTPDSAGVFPPGGRYYRRYYARQYYRISESQKPRREPGIQFGVHGLERSILWEFKMASL